jgi:hypothetical protein
MERSEIPVRFILWLGAGAAPALRPANAPPSSTMARIERTGAYRVSQVFLPIAFVRIPSCLSRFPGNHRIGVPGLKAILRGDSFAFFSDEILDFQWLTERCDLFDRVKRHLLPIGPRMTHTKEIPCKPTT